MTSRPPPQPPEPGARRITVVTTCHARGYEDYGRTMVETFLEHTPPDVPLWLYTEGFEADRAGERLVVHDLVASAPELVAFKARHRDRPMARGEDPRLRFQPRVSYDETQRKLKLRLTRRFNGFRWDAIRFAHKSFAIFDAAERADTDVLIWIDADTRFFADLTRPMLESFVPPDRMVGCLKRRDYTECGFVAYNLRHPAVRGMLADFKAMYTRDLLFREQEFHDSWLFDVVRKRAERRGALSYDIAEGVGMRTRHVLINSRLGSFMDHLKGGRTAEGASSAVELVVPRTEAYWTERR